MSLPSFQINHTHQCAMAIVQQALSLRNSRSAIAALVLATANMLHDARQATGTPFESLSDSEINRVLRELVAFVNASTEKS